jgi:hypothetical protein
MQEFHVQVRISGFDRVEVVVRNSSGQVVGRCDVPEPSEGFDFDDSSIHFVISADGQPSVEVE